MICGFTSICVHHSQFSIFKITFHPRKYKYMEHIIGVYILTFVPFIASQYYN